MTKLIAVLIYFTASNSVQYYSIFWSHLLNWILLSSLIFCHESFIGIPLYFIRMIYERK